VLEHVGWPTVGLAVVVLIGRAIRDKDQTRRLMGLIVVLVAVVVGSVAICVELLGMQMPGFHIPAMTRAAAPVATASPRTAPPVAVSPVATASPSSPGVYPDESGRRVRSAQQSRRARTSRAASSPHGCPGPSTPTANAWATRARSARPATVTLSRISRPAISAPAFPGRQPPAHHRDRQAGCTDTRSTQRPTSSRNTRPARPRPWPSVNQPTVHTDRPSGRTPSAMRPWTPRHAGLQRCTVTHGGTEKKRPA